MAKENINEIAVFSKGVEEIKKLEKTVNEFNQITSTLANEILKIKERENIDEIRIESVEVSRKLVELKKSLEDVGSEYNQIIEINEYKDNILNKMNVISLEMKDIKEKIRKYEENEKQKKQNVEYISDEMVNLKKDLELIKHNHINKTELYKITKEVKQTVNDVGKEMILANKQTKDKIESIEIKNLANTLIEKIDLVRDENKFIKDEIIKKDEIIELSYKTIKKLKEEIALIREELKNRDKLDEIPLETEKEIKELEEEKILKKEDLNIDNKDNKNIETVSEKKHNDVKLDNSDHNENNKSEEDIEFEKALKKYTDEIESKIMGEEIYE